MFQTDAVNRSCKWYDYLNMLMACLNPATIDLLELARNLSPMDPSIPRNSIILSDANFAANFPNAYESWVKAKRAKRESSPAPADQLPLRLPAGSPPPPAPVRQALVSQPKEGARKTNMAKLNR